MNDGFSIRFNDASEAVYFLEHPLHSIQCEHAVTRLLVQSAEWRGSEREVNGGCMEGRKWALYCRGKCV